MLIHQNLIAALKSLGRPLAIILALLLIPLGGFAADNIKTVKAKIEYQQSRYLLGAGDILSLEVLNEPEYTQKEVLVRPDGSVTLMGLGEVFVANKTIEEVTEEIRNTLSQTIIEPGVMLSIVKTRPGIVYLSGAVIHPGMFQFSTNTKDRSYGDDEVSDNSIRTDMRLSNILSNAGGVCLDADLQKVTLTRAVTGQTIQVDLWKIIKDGAYEEDIWVNSGDHIHIPKGENMAISEEDYKILLSSSIGPRTFPVRVIGKVTTPGIYELQGTSPFLNSAIAKAGGYTSQANQTKIAIRRFTDENHFTTFMIDANKYDWLLRPNDVVYIFEGKLQKTSRIAQEISRVLSPFQTAASALGWISNSARIFLLD